jgi:hypothetical protein
MEAEKELRLVQPGVTHGYNAWMAVQPAPCYSLHLANFTRFAFQAWR